MQVIVLQRQHVMSNGKCVSNRHLCLPHLHLWGPHHHLQVNSGSCMLGMNEGIMAGSLGGVLVERMVGWCDPLFRQCAKCCWHFLLCLMGFHHLPFLRAWWSTHSLLSCWRDYSWQSRGWLISWQPKKWLFSRWSRNWHFRWWYCRGWWRWYLRGTWPSDDLPWMSWLRNCHCWLAIVWAVLSANFQKCQRTDYQGFYVCADAYYCHIVLSCSRNRWQVLRIE